MPHTRIKVCGITCLEDAEFAVAAGVDALGFNFFAESPRCVDAKCAAGIIAALPPFVTSVGLFVNHELDEVKDIIRVTGVDLAQLHGDEAPGFGPQLGRPFIRVLRVGAVSEVPAKAVGYPGARAYLADKLSGRAYGGTGETIEWDMESPSLVLAGGLDADNVGEAIRRVRPFAVDVSSGVESEPGRKDSARVSAFVDAVRSADQDLQE